MARRILISLCVLLMTISALNAQDSGLQFVKKQYPQLSAMFQKELVSEHATYTFAIDVSGTMKKYSEIVIPALNSFVDALPNGDYVRIIRFGTTAKGSENGYLGTINSNLKGDLRRAISQLYTNPNDDKAFRAHTDIPAVMKEVSVALQNSENNMNFVFILTDFRNDQFGSGEHKIVSKDLQQIYYDLEPAAIGKNGRIVALRLPVDVNAAGYCLDQLKNEVFTKVELGYEMQDITSDAALSSWFEELKKQIMVERLRTIVSAENKVADISFSTDINIDGDVVASVSWQPNKLFGAISIDSSFVQNKRIVTDSLAVAAIDRSNLTASGFTFDNNIEVFTQTTETLLTEIPLGRIRHSSWGFHKLDDELSLGVDMPTPYDDELRRLGIRKPIPDVAIPVQGWKFTFFLPFWLCATIVGLIILYLILVMIKAGKNASAYFTKTIKVYDYVSQEQIKKVSGARIKDKAGVSVTGLKGMTLTYYKKTYSPFCLFKQPRLEGRVDGGYACNARGQRDSVKTSGSFYLQDNQKNIIFKVNLS